MKNWNMIIGLPRTGSSWFGSVLKNSTNFNYFREYFNPWTWLKHDFREGCKDLILNDDLSDNNPIYLRRAFGKESMSFDTDEAMDKIKFIARPWENNDELLNVFNKTWPFSKEKKIIDKEVWSFCNIGFFYEYFNISLLHRKADLIFWGTPETNTHTYKFYVSIYNSFILNADFHDLETRKLIVYSNDLKKQCLTGHKLASHIIFRESEKYNLPVIDYESLISCETPSSIESYLKNKLPKNILTNNVVENIFNSKFEKNFIQKRKIQTTSFIKKKIKLI